MTNKANTCPWIPSSIRKAEKLMDQCICRDCEPEHVLVEVNIAIVRNARIMWTALKNRF